MTIAEVGFDRVTGTIRHIIDAAGADVPLTDESRAAAQEWLDGTGTAFCAGLDMGASSGIAVAQHRERRRAERYVRWAVAPGIDAIRDTLIAQLGPQVRIIRVKGTVARALVDGYHFALIAGEWCTVLDEATARAERRDLAPGERILIGQLARRKLPRFLPALRRASESR